MLKNWPTKNGISVSDAEKKWENAKNSVDKSKYDDEDSYWSVVTTVFKKMMGEESNIGVILNFDDFLLERFGFSRSENDANRNWSVNHTDHVKSIKHTNPFASVDKTAEQRKQEVHGAAMKHVRQGDHKTAFDAAYKVAHQHAKADLHGDAAAHEIAQRRAKHAVKTAQDAIKR